MTLDTARSRAHHALEQAVSALMDSLRENHDDYDDVVAVDAVLIIGTQWIDDDGDRAGGVSALPRHGSQPYYTTLGLVESLRQMLIDKATSD